MNWDGLAGPPFVVSICLQRLGKVYRTSGIDLAQYSCTFFSTQPSLQGDAQGLAVVVMRAHQNTIAD
jgi:hypothetical protein